MTITPKRSRSQQRPNKVSNPRALTYVSGLPVVDGGIALEPDRFRHGDDIDVPALARAASFAQQHQPRPTVRPWETIVAPSLDAWLAMQLEHLYGRGSR